MSTSHSIAFLAKGKSPMIRFMVNTIKKFGKEDRCPMFKFIDSYYYGNQSWVHVKGETPEYFGGEEVCKKYPELTVWITMGGSNMIYREGNKSYQYPVPMFNRLLDEIKKSDITNDVYMLCYNDIGGDANKTNPKFRKSWTGKFI